jgi:hypothetical protein
LKLSGARSANAQAVEGRGERKNRKGKQEVERTLITAQRASQVKRIARVIFTIDRDTAKVVSIAPIVDSDEELNQLEPWLQACLILSDLIRIAKENNERVAA